MNQTRAYDSSPLSSEISQPVNYGLPSESISASSSYSSLSNRMQCYGCKRYGHKIRDCPNRQFNSVENECHEQATFVKEVMAESSVGRLTESLGSSSSLENTEVVVRSEKPIIQVLESRWIDRPIWGWVSWNPQVGGICY